MPRRERRGDRLPVQLPDQRHRVQQRALPADGALAEGVDGRRGDGERGQTASGAPAGTRGVGQRDRAGDREPQHARDWRSGSAGGGSARGRASRAWPPARRPNGPPRTRPAQAGRSRQEEAESHAADARPSALGGPAAHAVPGRCSSARTRCMAWPGSAVGGDCARPCPTRTVMLPWGSAFSDQVVHKPASRVTRTMGRGRAGARRRPAPAGRTGAGRGPYGAGSASESPAHRWLRCDGRRRPGMRRHA